MHVRSHISKTTVQTLYSFPCILPIAIARQCNKLRRTSSFVDQVMLDIMGHCLWSFYRAMLCIRGTSHGPVSVCLSVCLSVRPSVRHKSVFY